ncbi:ABC transporter ATP-binding protein [Carnobacterium gallinarum]|uniref:ABC transporter ATP-binding protein n=1 Tax=Carnobacterium gallinarum TaxID=2749 RepID=UPI000554C55F|nr:ABC transporter ATP-binding protein [Carnobacterium gallinarum]
MIKFENVSKEYKEHNSVVSNLNLEIKAGEFFVLIGPSGSGKTTTLKMINRLISLTTGTIWIQGKRISEYHLNELRWNIGYVLQQIALFPNMTIEENITIVPEMKKWSKVEMKERVTELLNSVGLDAESYRNRKPDELSGGEQQRVGVIRALAANPDIILMDEPFSALDPISRKKLQEDVAELQKKVKKTIVFVTHDMQEALALGDRICIMRDGEIVQIGTPDEICQSPKDDFVREFLQSGHISIEKETQTIRELLLTQQYEPYVQQFNTEHTPLYLTSEASIDDLILKLADLPEVLIYDSQKGLIIGKITSQNLVAFFANEVKKAGNTL